MGLDMYLLKKTFVGAQFELRKVSLTIDLSIGERRVNIDTSRVSEIVEQVGYWRKANAIHKWFVDNVQDGVDECQEAYVTREQLQQLLDTVNEVLGSMELEDGLVSFGKEFVNGELKDILRPGQIIKDPGVAKELLPAQEGFFFGSTDYDQWYYQDLVYTKEILEDVLAWPESYDESFYYHSSW